MSVVVRQFASGLLWVAFALCVASPSGAVELVVSQYGRVTATLPWAVAQEKGYFADEGLKIDKIISGGGGGTTLRNMLASDLPYGEVATSAALAAIRSGIELVIVNTASEAGLYGTGTGYSANLLAGRGRLASLNQRSYTQGAGTGGTVSYSSGQMGSG